MATEPEIEIAINMPVTPDNSDKIGRLRMNPSVHLDCIKLALKTRAATPVSPAKKQRVALLGSPATATRTPPRVLPKKALRGLVSKPLIQSVAMLASAQQHLKSHTKKPAPAPPPKKNKPAVVLKKQPPVLAPKPAKVATAAKAVPPVHPKAASKPKKARPATLPKIAAPTPAPKVDATGTKVAPPKPVTKPKLVKVAKELPIVVATAAAKPILLKSKPAPPTTKPKPAKKLATMSEKTDVAIEQAIKNITALQKTMEAKEAKEATTVEAPVAEQMAEPAPTMAPTMAAAAEEANETAEVNEPRYESLAAAAVTPQKLESSNDSTESTVCPPTVSKALMLDTPDKELAEDLSKMVTMSMARIATEQAVLDQEAYHTADGGTNVAARAQAVFKMFCEEAEAEPTEPVDTAPPTLPDTGAPSDDEDDEQGDYLDDLAELTQNTKKEVAPAPAAVVEETETESSCLDMSIAEVVCDIVTDLVDCAATDAAAATAMEECGTKSVKHTAAPSAAMASRTARLALAATQAQDVPKTRRESKNAGAPVSQRVARLKNTSVMTPPKPTSTDVSTPCLQKLQSVKGAVSQLAARFEAASTPTKTKAVVEPATEEPLWKLALNKARQFSRTETEPKSPRRNSNAQPVWKRELEKARQERTSFKSTRKDSWKKAPKSSKENVLGSLPAWKSEWKSKKSLENGAAPLRESIYPNKSTRRASTEARKSLGLSDENSGSPAWMRQARAARRRNATGMRNGLY